MSKKEKLLKALEAIIASTTLTDKFRETFDTDFKMIKSCIEADFVKTKAEKLILELGGDSE